MPREMPEDLRAALDELDEIESAFGRDGLLEGDMIEPMCAKLKAQKQLVSALLSKYRAQFALERLGA